MFSFDSRVRFSECGTDGRMTPEAIVNYFQDCAVFHAVSFGSGPDKWRKEQRGWVIASWRIRIFEYPKLGTQVTTSTWSYGFRGIEGKRNHTMTDGAGYVFADADSRWAFFDFAAGRPIAVPDSEIEGYGVEKRREMGEAPLHIRIPREGAAVKEPVKVRPTNLDTNGHMNNEQYIALALTLLPAGIRVKEMSVEYHRQALLGDELVPHVARDEEGYTVWFMLGQSKCSALRFVL